MIVWHKPDIPEADKAALRRVFDLYPRDTLIVERANIGRARCRHRAGTSACSATA